MSFQLGRLLSYSAAGAVAAASVQLLGQMGQATAMLRPIWVLVHVAAFLLGLALLWRGRQPAWLERVGQDVGRQVEIPVAGLRRGGSHKKAPGPPCLRGGGMARLRSG